MQAQPPDAGSSATETPTPPGDPLPDASGFTTVNSLMSDSIEAILVKGEPGTGKTTFAIELLKTADGGVYISTRVSRQRLLGQIPGVKEMLISETRTKGRSGGGSVELGDMRLATPGDILKQIIERGIQPKKELVVLDSWDGIAKEVSGVDRMKVEKTLLVVAESRNKKLVFISEEPGETAISYLVDAVVELRRTAHDGAIVRTIETQKLRGSPIVRPRSLFTLAGGQFQEFGHGQPVPLSLTKRSEFRSTPHYEDAYSSGMPEMDLSFAGGLRKGTVDLLEFGENLNSAVHYGTYNIIFCNFILNGGCALMVPGGGGNYTQVTDLAKLMLPEDSVLKNLAVGVFEKYDDPCLFQLSQDSVEDCFAQLWTKMTALKGKSHRPLVMMIGLDTLESIFDERKLLYHISRTNQLVRRNRDVLAITCGASSRLRSQLMDLCDFHAKYEIIDESLVVHGLNPPGPIAHIRYDNSRGYPYPVFTPIL